MADQNPQFIITKEMLQKTKRAYVQMDPGEQLKVFVSSSVAENYVVALMSRSKQVDRAVLFLDKRQRDAFFSELKKRSANNYIRNPVKDVLVFKKLCKIVKKTFESAEPNLKSLWDDAKAREGENFNADEDVTSFTATGRLVLDYTDLVIFPEVVIYLLQLLGKTAEQAEALFAPDLEEERRALQAEMRELLAEMNGN